MNYRHAFHAGNFADVHKHAVLARILDYLRQKPAAFRVIDSHAGAGRYDLGSSEAVRGGEWPDGIGRIFAADCTRQPLRLLAPYLDAVRAFNPGGRLSVYPGSPLIVQNLLRPQDRLVACELEPAAAAALAAVLRGRPGAKAVAIDGWTAIGAYVPPKERRGLVLIDPPYEQADDFTRLTATLAAAQRKWPSGIYLLWYPIKTRDAPDALARRLIRLAVPKVLRCELTIAPPGAEAGLTGSGLIVVNPPFPLAGELKAMLPALCSLLGPRAAAAVDWLAGEA
jgi:23S rRNA (adenine2030-N6)-methyltransferase